MWKERKLVCEQYQGHWSITDGAKMESRGSRQKGGCKTFVEGMRMEEIQQRLFSSSCMVFLMRRSMVVSHWSSREIVSYSFTCQQNRGNAQRKSWGEVIRSVKYINNVWQVHFLLKYNYTDSLSQWRHPRSAPHRHLEVSVSFFVKSKTKTNYISLYNNTADDLL